MKFNRLKYSYPNAQEIYDENLDRLGLMDEKQPENMHRRENNLDEDDEKEIEDGDDELEKLKKIQERRKNKKEHTHNIIQPHPFYTSEYGNLSGLEGLMSTPLADYSANIADSPDAVTNPYNDTYQAASERSIRIKLRAEVFRNIKR
jgi:ABC-type Zn2+ transport system substrate-binding protein/surface adhesin